jgi:hypothetical protein
MQPPVGPDQQRRQVLAGGVHRDQADLRVLRVSRLLGCVSALLEQADHLGGVGGECLASPGQPYAAAMPLEQRRPQLAGERRDRGRDGRLADQQLPGRGVNAAGAVHRKEGADLTESDRHRAPAWLHGAARNWTRAQPEVIDIYLSFWLS